MLQSGRPGSSFTMQYNGRTLALVTDVHVGPAIDLQTKNPSVFKPYKAIWDTGATNSVITHKVVTECGLKPISRTVVKTAGGDAECLVYLVCIGLPNRVRFAEVRVTEAPITDGMDVLIGMDLIGEGDFAVTTSDGKTTFTYCYPSCRHLDFVEESKAANTHRPEPYPNTGRNALCPCGSGKKYKNCCLQKAREKA